MTDPAPSRVFGTAGHIDHGKTALVRALTGMNTDRLPDEQERGITIDLGFAYLRDGEDRLAFVDVPGHERFVRNMLAGATGIDLALLVVAADDSVMPQTREHLEILRLLKIPAGVVALTKCDLVEPDWLSLVESDVRSLVSGTNLESARIIRTSAVSGLGLDELKRELVRLARATPPPRDTGLFRIAVDRSFTLPGHGTVVTGTIASGTVTIGDELEHWPSGERVRVRGLHQHDRQVEHLARGERAALNLAGIRHDQIRRGHELAHPGSLRESRVLSVQVQASPGAPRPLRHRMRYRVHLGTRDVTGTLGLLEGRELDGDRPALAQLFLMEPVVAVHGQPFVLREESPAATVGGGQVLEPVSRRYRRGDLATRERLDRLRAEDPIDRIHAALALRPLGPWNELDLCRETGVPITRVPELVSRLRTTGNLVEVPIAPRRSALFPIERLADLEARLLRTLSRLHEAHPRLASIRRSWIGPALPDLSPETLAELIERLRRQNRVVGNDQGIALVDHQPRLSRAESQLKNDLRQAIQSGGFTPPDHSDLLQRAGSRAAIISELLSLLIEEGEIVDIGGGLLLDARAEVDLRRRVSERLADGSSLTMAGLRDLLGTTRKYAVPFGEYLDRIGLTRREGDNRSLAVRPASPENGPAA